MPVWVRARRKSSHSPGLSSIKRMEGCVTMIGGDIAGIVPGSKRKSEIVEW